MAAERGYTETDWFRSYNTFRFGQYHNPDKGPFGNLYVLNNDTLAGGKSFSLLVEEDAEIVIIPTVGAVRFSDSNNNEITIEAGQALQLTILQGITLTFKNPYAEDPVNFLQLWMKKQAGSAVQLPNIDTFDIEHNRNNMVKLFPENRDAASRFFIGKFYGRQEIEYTLDGLSKGLFLYVLEGAFEVAYRLLETGDALALWDIETAEIEALSNDAIILLLELKL